MDPNGSKPRNRRKNYTPLPVPTLPTVPADAAQYRAIRASPAHGTESPALFGTIHLPSASNSPSSPISPLFLTTPLEHNAALPTSPDITWLTDTLASLEVAPEKKKYLSRYEHVDAVLHCILDHFMSLAHFMEALTENFPVGSSDPRSDYHRLVVSSWLGGRSTFGPAHFVEAIYHNRYSVPCHTSVHVDELDQVFDGQRDPKDFHYARPALSAWATQLVGKRCALEIGKLGHDDPNHPDFHAFLRSATNARSSGKHPTASQEDVFQFSMERSATILQSRAPLAWYLTECMAATRKKGAVITRTRRPHPLCAELIFGFSFYGPNYLQIQVAALSSFAIARNRSAKAYFALPIGIYLFATKAHTDVKRMLCKLGLSVHDTTVRRALKTMGAKRKEMLQALTAASLTEGAPGCRVVLDNIQQYQIVREHGLCKQSQLMTGTAATAILLDNCVPGAFDLRAYHDRVIRKERSTLTVNSLLEDINFEHLHQVSVLHVVRILCKHIPCLETRLPLISERLRSHPLALYLLPADRPPTRIVPLGANSRAEMETHEMKEAQQDFDCQVGYSPANVCAADVLIWNAGDGGSVLSGGRVARHLLPQGISLNALWTPGLFHVQLHMINGLAENHFGPATASDPSTLSRAASLASLFRAFGLGPVVTGGSAITSAYQFEYCRAIAEAEWKAKAENKLPSLDELISVADLLVHRFASDRGLETALSLSAFNKAPNQYKFKTGESTISSDTQFEGDRVLANTIAFRRDFLLYMELSDAILEGDIGRVCEVLKLLIFFFASASKQNYTTILLDVYCLFKFEATKELKDAIWNNWVVNLTGELRKNVPDDELQEWHNRFHEDMVPKHGGSFDDPFFRETISPNVNFFQRLKEEMEKAFALKAHRKTHTSSSTTHEIQTLTAMYRREKVHLFCPGRSKEHTATDLINEGYTTLDKGKLSDFLRNSTEHAKVLDMIRRHRHSSSSEENPTSDLPDLRDSDDSRSDSDGDSDSDSDSDGGDSNGSNGDSRGGEDEEPEDERPVKESAWQFHMDEEDDGGWENEGDEEDGESEEEEWVDQDVDVAGVYGDLMYQISSKLRRVLINQGPYLREDPQISSTWSRAASMVQYRCHISTSLQVVFFIKAAAGQQGSNPLYLLLGSQLTSSFPFFFAAFLAALDLLSL
ncbi:hypothetical protein C8R45DRAFT_1084422 [Mycena sanguinolenta]|nr:hypothetical protein C8R45DRAFT_1084422 [Mycena sanguinolenta]